MEMEGIKKHLKRNERELINLIKNCPSIYDSSTQAFRTPENREKEWKSIADELNASVVDIKKRWRSLRERYSRELKRMKEDPDAYKDLSNVWEFSSSMSFLDNYIKSRTTTPRTFRQQSNKALKSIHNKRKREITYNIDTDSNDDKISIDNKDDINISNITEYIKDDANNDFQFEENDIYLNSSTNEHNEPVMVLEDTLSIKPPKMIKRKASPDEDDFFCNAIACSLKKLSRLHNVKAKVEIYKILEHFIEAEESIL